MVLFAGMLVKSIVGHAKYPFMGMKRDVTLKA
ncbi:MAG: hypothetical protein KPEEDBHJ_02099 [Anaerolineales bacterium]|nr:hypothetical protein [Anaerolineales bacterium]